MIWCSHDHTFSVKLTITFCNSVMEEAISFDVLVIIQCQISFSSRSNPSSDPQEFPEGNGASSLI